MVPSPLWPTLERPPQTLASHAGSYASHVCFPANSARSNTPAVSCFAKRAVANIYINVPQASDVPTKSAWETPVVASIKRLMDINVEIYTKYLRYIIPYLSATALFRVNQLARYHLCRSPSIIPVPASDPAPRCRNHLCPLPRRLPGEPVEPTAPAICHITPIGYLVPSCICGLVNDLQTIDCYTDYANDSVDSCVVWKTRRPPLEHTV